MCKEKKNLWAAMKWKRLHIRNITFFVAVLGTRVGHEVLGDRLADGRQEVHG